MRSIVEQARTRTKVCGVTRPEDAKAAALAGVDAIGLVFYDASPRSVTVDQAREIVAAVPAFVTITGLFVNPSRMDVEQVLSQVPLDLLQFHGDEAPDFCGQFHRRWIKAVRVQESADIIQAFEHWSQASGLLVDAYDPKLYGGTGKQFDWSVIPKKRPLPIVLAGGLNSANVASAIRQVGPWGVDVSGGVEAADDSGNPLRGIKDASKISEFLSEVNRVNQAD